MCWIFFTQINLSVTRGGKHGEVSGHVKEKSISIMHKLLSEVDFETILPPANR